MTREERVQKLAHTQPAGEPKGVASIPVTDLKVGDQILWGGRPWSVTNVERDGPIVVARTEVPAGRLDFMAIERVDVLHPRPHEQEEA
jgi:hypothetical protein